jgi:hypothetical protein
MRRTIGVRSASPITGRGANRSTISMMIPPITNAAAMTSKLS